MKAIKQIIGFSLTMLLIPFAFSAPKVPKIVTDNGLIYCTHSSGFSFNPQTADAGTSMNVVTEQIYNKLFELKKDSHEIVPALARSYSFSADRKTLVINLRKGIKFHQTEWFTPSRDFNADDVVFSLNRILGTENSLPDLYSEAENRYKTSQYAVFHQQARQARFPYFESINLNRKIDSITATNPYQITIKLTSPDASILSHLASQYAVILSYEYALQLNADDNLVQLDLLPVGTGPYKLKSYFRDSNVRLVRNTDYWRKSNSKVENVVIDLSTTRIGRLAKFLNNECDIAAFPDSSQLGLLYEKSNNLQVKSTKGMNLSFLALNALRPSMQDKTLPKILAYAINRKRIIKQIYYNTATIADTLIPQVSWAWKEDSAKFSYDYDPEQAKQLLTHLAEEDKTLNLWVIDEEQVYNPNPIKMAEMIKFDLAQVGITLHIKTVTRNYLAQQLQQHRADYDLILTGWLAGNLDPDGFLNPILSCSSQNRISNLSNWCHPHFDNIMIKALQAKDIAQRADYYNIAQHFAMQQLAIIPLAHVERVLIAQKRVKGLTMTPFGSINFDSLSLGEP